ncbi:hypothetical protein C8J56DRAFT_899008 [Mycena floridula]|nr:hypothetical protein C8J56DRAFT_899008 [Mycena floridula]
MSSTLSIVVNSDLDHCELSRTYYQIKIQFHFAPTSFASASHHCGVSQRRTKQHSVNVPSNFNDAISSVGPDPDQDCFFFADANCNGSRIGPIRSPGVGDLRTTSPPLNDAISSQAFLCQFGPIEAERETLEMVLEKRMMNEIEEKGSDKAVKRMIDVSCARFPKIMSGGKLLLFSTSKLKLGPRHKVICADVLAA